ncbi:MAG: hypothetical protein WB930_04435 [Syntrophobacteraceae bacterium]
MLSPKSSAQLIGQWFERGGWQLECSPGKPDRPWGAAFRVGRTNLCHGHIALAEQYRFPSCQAVKIPRQMGLGFMYIESDRYANLN